MSIILALALGAILAGIVSAISVKALLALVPMNHKSPRVLPSKNRHISS